MQRAIDRAALGSQASPRGWDLARLQRAPVGSDQSTRSRGDHEVERRGVRLEGARGGAVVLRHRPMRAEHDRLLLGRQPSVPDRTLHPLEPYHGTVSHFGHGPSLLRKSRETHSPRDSEHLAGHPGDGRVGVVRAKENIVAPSARSSHGAGPRNGRPAPRNPIASWSHSPRYSERSSVAALLTPALATLPPLVSQALASFASVNPWPLQAFWPLQSLLEPLHDPLPLQSLAPWHFTAPRCFASLLANAAPLARMVHSAPAII